MDPFLEHLDAWANELKDSRTHFLRHPSSIAPMNMEEGYSMSPEGNRYYSDLDAVGTKMQSYLSACYARFQSLIAPLLEGQPDDVISKMHKSTVLITRTIEHKLTFCNTTREALDLALAALDGQVAIVRELYRARNQGA